MHNSFLSKVWDILNMKICSQCVNRNLITLKLIEFTDSFLLKCTYNINSCTFKAAAWKNACAYCEYCLDENYVAVPCLAWFDSVPMRWSTGRCKGLHCCSVPVFITPPRIYPLRQIFAHCVIRALCHPPSDEPTISVSEPSPPAADAPDQRGSVLSDTLRSEASGAGDTTSQDEVRPAAS